MSDLYFALVNAVVSDIWYTGLRYIGTQLYFCSMVCITVKTFSISHTKSQSLNVSCILFQLSSLNPLEPGVKLRMKM